MLVIDLKRLQREGVISVWQWHLEDVLRWVGFEIWPTEAGSEPIADIDEVFGAMEYGLWYLWLKECDAGFACRREWEEAAKRIGERLLITLDLGLGWDWEELISKMPERGKWGGVTGSRFPNYPWHYGCGFEAVSVAMGCGHENTGFMDGDEPSCCVLNVYHSPTALQEVPNGWGQVVCANRR